MTSLIEAYEERAVAIFDIPGAFLHADIEEDVIMVLEGPLADMMVQFDPSLYSNYITTNLKGKPLLHVKMCRALYGMLISALLFYRKLEKYLEEYGFGIKLYEPCVANKMVNGSQMTVVWHVDDLKVSHKSEFEITRFADYLISIYVGLLSSRGKVHDYLGMNLDFSDKGNIKVSMIPYLLNVLKEFPEELGASA